MAINLIVASSQNGVIGKDGKMPWNLPEDLKRFKEITDGSIVIMGRKTFESIGKPLSNRYNFVISKNENYLPGVFCFNSVDSAIDGAIRWFPEYDIFVIGGASIYQQFLERGLVNRIYQTLIKKDFEGDTFFNFDKENWKIIERQDSDECSYITWEKNQ
jgi:dihydrofolate reductase